MKTVTEAHQMQSVTMTPEMSILLLLSHDELPRPYHADEAHFLVNKTGWTEMCGIH